ncbi:LPS-assembly protein LptD [Acinetobacter bereziniae]|uniref:LPS-assembly protein LptD n=1 Tax=Acinetobacter bereziniae TaxID=106648 RepID=UPI001904EE89|nr:LPS-assembly protein LptD [Acinetobacter bereziniae]MDG3556713.1 LPS-assembly protein LptD [Acinetobacter bereziniae]MDP5999938.1 LPS-assembly protein LptD [Acinetobacter bereziniae]QQC82349.1 LPS-assembly protein LptD [Acinetobacter bereziniae]UUN95486.1 LPS-assembly protein LptD [Acinetobacter bereziniae]WMW76433.1 LPS-assembly protein LptD [Acinetobacter bereziniae]
MKHQFKFNPLATAILTLLCGSSVSSYAESTTSVSEAAVSKVNNKQLNAAIKESYPGQNFFEQYYVDKNAPEAQVRDENNASNRYCEGVWVTPFSTQAKTVDPQEASSVITADQAYYNPNGDSVLSGDVMIDQSGRMIRADEVTIDKTQTFAKAKGNVQMAQGGIIAQSDQIDYNLKDETGQLNNSFYIAEITHAHGHAAKIERTSPTNIVLENASYSTCPPDQKPTWKIQANKIELDQETGRGVTRGTKLYVKDVPVLAVPYFNFPIDDRRTTGIISPNFGFTNDGGFELAVPVYLNLAPNYDATITPRLITDRGLMAQGEFRYLTENFGAGSIWGSYLPSDRGYDDEDRKDLHFLHRWNIDKQWSTNLEYNYVSDKDFFSDLDSNPNSRTELNQRRAWELNYNHGIPGLKAQLKVEDFQTLDKTVKDVDRPYARLPQFLLNYVGGDYQGWEYEFNNDTAYFKKDINDADYSNQPSGTRLYNQFATRYNFRNPWSFVIPEVSVRSLNTFYDQTTVDQLNLNNQSQDSKNKSVVVPQFTLDTGLTFEKDGKFLQTITPRAFYAYAPYKNQTGYPNFDSTSASISYDQLFSPYRFYGHDRLEDNNFLSLGVSYSLFDTVGLERLRASIGQSYYFDDRKVTLLNNTDELDKEKHTGPVISISSQLSQKFTVSTNSAWMSNGDSAQHDFQMYYTGEKGNLYNVGYFYRNNLPDRQREYDQAVASFIQPVKDNWRIMGHVQYDLDNHVAREYLLGVNYESCCWGISVYGRSYFNDLDDVSLPDTKPKRAVMAEITLKGLGGLNNKLSSLLQNRILGFDKANQSWTH